MSHVFSIGKLYGSHPFHRAPGHSGRRNSGRSQHGLRLNSIYRFGICMHDIYIYRWCKYIYICINIWCKYIRMYCMYIHGWCIYCLSLSLHRPLREFSHKRAIPGYSAAIPFLYPKYSRIIRNQTAKIFPYPLNKWS